MSNEPEITPHLAWPPRIGPDGTFVTVDERSVTELQQCVGLVLSTRAGSLIDNPEFGRPALVAQHEGIAAQQAAAACAKWEPRASDDIISEGITDHSETIDVTVSGNG